MVKKYSLSHVLIVQQSITKKLFFVFLSCMFFLSISSYSATYYSIASGDWNVASTWSSSCGGPISTAVPASGDDVVICNGTIVSITTNQFIANVTINGTGSLNFITPSTLLTLSGNFTMNNTSAITGSGRDRGINLSGNFFVSPTANVTIGDVKLSVTGTFNIGTSATVTLNTGSTASKSFGHFSNNGTWNNTSNNVPIIIRGNFENNGTFNQGTGKVTFIGATSNTITGTALLTAFDTLVVQKYNLGTPADQNNVLDVQSIITLGAGKLFFRGGTFKLSSASTIVPFSASNYIISLTSRLWNNGGTINSTADFNYLGIAGTLQNSAGTMNVGVASNHAIIVLSGSVIAISGGAVNVAGRIYGNVAWTYTMSGGTLSLGVVGNIGTLLSPFDMDNVSASFTMTGGTIIIVNGTLNTFGSALTDLGYRNYSTLGGGFTGGTLQIGTDTTPATTGKMRIQTTRPIYNLEVVGNNTIALSSSSPTIITTSLTITNDVTITSGVLDIGTNTQDLFVGGNWKNTSTATDPFIEGIEKVTFNGTSGTQTISNSGAVNGTTFYDLTINNTSLTVPQVKTTANVAVKNTLTMIQGKVNLSGTTLTLGTGPASVASIGSLAFPPYSNSTQPLTWMYGGTFKRWFRTTALPIRNIAGLFPLGSETDYHPLWFNYSAALTTGGTFSVTHAPSGPGSVAIPNYSDASCGLTIKGISNASWVLSTNVVPTGNTLGISYGGFGFANFLNTDLNASNALGTAGNCSSPSNVNPGIYFEVNRSALSLTAINKAWYIGTANLIQSPLPIELLSFDANSNQQVVDLNWSTASETNSDYFTIEKTRDGYNFETVVTVDAAGNSTSLLPYATKDNSPYQGISYYRLKQTDFNGAYTYSDLQMVDFNSNQEFSFEIYPNPADGSIFNIAFNSGFNEEFLIVVRDMMGRECYSKTIFVQENQKNSFAIDPYTDLIKGIYLVSVRSMNRSQNKLLTIQ